LFMAVAAWEIGFKVGFQVPNLQNADVTFRSHAAVPHRLLR
jgi:hypothetical protein